ncbi:MAG: DUF2723 domain-containing protein [Gemmatimonadota bacterium]|nr:MAG: DUF2723 domain-containing protein [Gemmatimonadota bacterium]
MSPTQSNQMDPQAPGHTSEEAPPRTTGRWMEAPIWAIGSAALVGLLYAVTLAPTTAFWDTSEYIATSHMLGIPHPPGNPLFVVLARAWDLLLTPFGLPVAVRINLFSAMMGAAAHGLWFMVVHRILGYFSRDRVFRLVGAATAVLVSATAFTVWSQSNVNEKVYTVSLFTIALLSWLAFYWRENIGKGKDDNLLVLILFLLALSVGNHLMAFLAAPALAAFVLMTHPKTLVNWRLYVAGAVAMALGLSIHLFLPLRAALDPVINEADPTCSSLGSALTSIVTWGQAGCAELSSALARDQYDKPPLIPRLAPLLAQYGNYFQYFDWQWNRSVAGAKAVLPLARLPVTLLFSALGLYGAVEHLRRDRISGYYTLILFGTLSVALVFYLNFKYGYSLSSPVADRALHEVRERDYFFIVSFSIWGLWVGIGLAALWQALAAQLRRPLKVLSPILAIAAIPLILNWSWATRSYDYSARDWAYNMLMSVEPYGVLFTHGDNDTFPLWYLQEAEGIRRDVTVIVTSYLNTNWYAKQLRQLTSPCPEGVDPADTPTRNVCQRPYDSAGQGALYTHDPAEADALGKVALLLDEPVETPTRSILPLSDEVIDQTTGPRGYVRLREARQFQMGSLVATLQGGQILYPWQQFALVIMSNSLGDRPVYFASSGNTASDLGVRQYTVRQGLAFRLMSTLPVADGNLVEMTVREVRRVSGPWLDLSRTRTLADEVFIHRTGLPDDWTHWPDQSTVSIPAYYSWLYLALAEAGRLTGDADLNQTASERTTAWQSFRP